VQMRFELPKRKELIATLVGSKFFYLSRLPAGYS
jgi:hypothetical protein